jgi:hypothetical protein
MSCAARCRRRGFGAYDRTNSQTARGRDMADYEFLEVERDGKLTIITINRPEV